MDNRPLTERPLASPGLISYRARNQFGWTMIGARDHEDAMVQARRSYAETEPKTLEIWDGKKYVRASRHNRPMKKTTATKKPAAKPAKKTKGKAAPRSLYLVIPMDMDLMKASHWKTRKEALEEAEGNGNLYDGGELHVVGPYVLAERTSQR